jgi:hypothetical protein
MKLNLKKKEELYKNVEKDVISDFYKYSTNKNKNFRFTMLDNNFNAFLPYLKDGTVKLYLYYALAAKNESGESWHSADTISKKLDVTDRSIINWNKELEDMGLIYRTSNGKKSKTTFILPLTGFTTKMNIEKINQIFTDLRLFDSTEHTRIFGKFHSLTKLYIKTEKQNMVNEIICVCLEKCIKIKNAEINKVRIFLYDFNLIEKSDLCSKITTENDAEDVFIVKEKESVEFGGKTFRYGSTNYNCYFINHTCKITDEEISENMDQLTANIDFSDMPKIEL